MADAQFDQAGNITNLEELTVEEVNDAQVAKKAEILARSKDSEAREKIALEAKAKAEADLEAVRGKINPKELEDVQDVKATVAQLQLAEQKRQYGYDNGLSPEETDKVFQLTGNKPNKEVLEDSFVKGGLEALRNKKRLADNTPSASHGSATFAAGKNPETMTATEKQEEFEKLMAAKARK